MPARQTILALDPSSTCTGYAVMTGPEPCAIVEAGYFRPREADPPYVRIDWIVEDMLGLLAQQPVDKLIMELTSGKVAKRHKGRGAGLAIYGVAVGEVRRAAIMTLGMAKVVGVFENDWTGGRPKLERRRAFAMLFPSLAEALAADTDGDLADAIGLGRWWFMEQQDDG